DVEGLAHRRAARRRGRHAVDVQAAGGDARRRARNGAVGLQVADAHQAGTDPAVRARGDGRVGDGPHDLLAEPPAVEPARAAPGQLAVGAGEVRVAEDRADGGDLPVREEQLAGRDDVAEPVRVQRGLVVELTVHDEPALGDPYGRAEQLAEVAAAEAAQGELPLRERAGHA